MPSLPWRRLLRLLGLRRRLLCRRLRRRLLLRLGLGRMVPVMAMVAVMHFVTMHRLHRIDVGMGFLCASCGRVRFVGCGVGCALRFLCGRHGRGGVRFGAVRSSLREIDGFRRCAAAEQEACAQKDD